MYKILKKTQKTENAIEYVIDAPRVAKHCKSGQFIILRVDSEGERTPFTICDYDRQAGSVTILVQTVGFTTQLLAQKKEGDFVEDFVGPLGHPTDLSPYKNIVLVGGGIGTAVIFPQSKQLFLQGKPAVTIIGARNKNLMLYQEELKGFSKELIVMTDDGSLGEKGFVTDALKKVLENNSVDCVLAVGPLPMMRAVAQVTRPLKIKTVVSMNSLMVDGTGMCGCCRVTVGGKVKYACVHGPEFDGHEVDFDEAINRSKNYCDIENEHTCRLTGTKR